MGMGSLGREREKKIKQSRKGFGKGKEGGERNQDKGCKGKVQTQV